MAGVSIIKFKDKEILYFDHRGLRDQELLENVKRSNKMTNDYNGTEILTLANFIDTIASQEVIDYLKSEESKEMTKKIKKGTVVGIVGIKKIFLNTFNAITGGTYKAFDTEEEAKEYLVK